MNELVAQSDSQMDMAIMRSPQLVLDEAKIAARALTDVISQKKKPVKFNGEQYLEFEDWLTIAKFYGLACRTYDPEPVSIDNGPETVVGAKARAEVVEVKSGRVIGAASAWCLRDEPNWRSKPWYQLGSMAQTRAGAKALRNLLSWVVVLAGYKTTPAEEMQNDAVEPIEADIVRERFPVSSSHAPDRNIVGDASIVSDILGKLVDMAQGDEDEAQKLLKFLTTYIKDGKESWVKVGDLDRIAKSNPKWIAVIHSKVSEHHRKSKAN